MYTQGWVGEVRGLLARGFSTDTPAMRSLGYVTIAEAIASGTDPDATVESVITLTQQYAKRQETFFRSMKEAQWFDVTRRDAIAQVEELVRERFGL